MREKRLARDKELLLALQANSDLIDVKFEGMFPERYLVIYSCRSLVWFEGNTSPSYSCRHELEIYLHKDYPRIPPALKWLTEIYHPNILPPKRNGGVCIGSWTAAETLDCLCLRIGEMLQYKSFNLRDPLDEEAASWVRNNLKLFPLDKRNLFGQP